MSDEKTVKEAGATYMTAATSAIIEPFVQRRLFENQETAVAEMARAYIVRQIQQCQQTFAATGKFCNDNIATISHLPRQAYCFHATVLKQPVCNQDSGIHCGKWRYAASAVLL